MQGQKIQEKLELGARTFRVLPYVVCVGAEKAQH